MASNWVRGKTERPKTRRIVLIYETADPTNAVLEQLLERIPYGRGNQTLLACLRVGAQASLAQLEDRAGIQGSRPASPPAAAPTPATAVAPAAGTAPEFSKAATRMFTMGDNGPT